jgi:hypothetical protein
MNPRRFRSQQLRQFLTTAQGKTYTVTFFTGLLVLILVVFVMLPSFTAIFGQLAENSEREAALQQVELKNSTIRTLLAQEQQNRAITVALQQNFPDKYNQSEISAHIIKLAEESSVFLTGVRFGKMDLKRPAFQPFPAETVDGKTLAISAVGSKGDLEKFVAAFENSQRIYNIRSINLAVNLNKQGEIDATAPFLISIQADIYYWKTIN